MKKLALFLALVMVLTALPAIQVEAHNRHDNQGQVKEFPFDFSHEQVQSPRMEYPSVQQETHETLNRPNNLSDPAISEARQKYDQLRTGNYNRGQVLERFQELFGYMSPDLYPT